MIDIRSLRDLVRLFYIFRREFWLALAGVAVLAVAGAFLLPPKYMSDARLLVKPGRENRTAGPGRQLSTQRRETIRSSHTIHKGEMTCWRWRRGKSEEAATRRWRID